MVRIKCPKCQTILPVDGAPAGTVVPCSQCGAKLRVPAIKPAPAPLTPGSASVQAAPPAPLRGNEREEFDEDEEHPIELEVDEEAISPLQAAVLAELERLQNQQPGWGGALAVLVVSLLLYMGAARVERAWDGLIILLPVLAFHELGHYVAMRCFGYRNLRMFFIPFFGAAVSGRHYNIAGWKKALVALAGPLPGILIGAPLGMVGLLLREPKVIEVAMLLLILNGFNLLPFLLLDGGWVVHAVLFVRHPVLDVLFPPCAGRCRPAVRAGPGRPSLPRRG
jgi:hypothetical protein